MGTVHEEREGYWNRIRLHQTVRDVALLFALAGIIASAAALVSLVRARAVANWPTVPGVVVSSDLETVPIAGRLIRYEAVVAISYRYEIEGQSFVGRSVTQGAPPVRAETADAERLLAAYPVDAPVRVFYNPDDPSEAVLEQDVAEGTLVLLLLFFGTALLLALASALLRP